MKGTKSTALLAVLALTGICATASAQRRSFAETSLAGVTLYDNAFKLLRLYGNPDDILLLGQSSTSAPGPAAGSAPVTGGAPAQGGGTGGAAQTGGPRRGGASVAGSAGNSAGGTGSGATNFMTPGGPGGPGSFMDPIVPTAPQRGSGPVNAGSNGSGAPTAAGIGVEQENGLPVTPAVARPFYIRWIYKRGGAKYSFLLDKFERIVQIEAIGLDNKKVRTKKGIGFGARYDQVLRTYGTPENYEIAGNQIIMRYSLKNKVVFRLNRLGLNKPHVVTGIVIAAGK